MSEKQRIFIKLSEKYIKDFSEKHGLRFCGWIGRQTENICEVASFNEGSISVDYSVIRYDIDKDLHADIFPNWYDRHTTTNYAHYCKYCV